MTNKERSAIVAKLIVQLNDVHESIIKVADTAAEIATDSPVLAACIMAGLVESQEPLAVLYHSAKSVLVLTAEPTSTTVQ